MTAVRFVSRISFGDIAESLFAITTRSTGVQAVMGFMVGLGVIGLLAGAPLDVWLPPVLIGLAVGTGVVFAPFAWWSLRKRKDLLTETVEADGSGLTIESPGTHIRQEWTVYREARETGRLFILTSGGTAAQMFSKHGVSQSDVEAFRSILRQTGLLRERPAAQRFRAWLGFAAGAVAAIVFLVVIGGVRFIATP